MARQNRVSPEGKIVAAEWRGSFMGNRGILHDQSGALGIARWRHPHWITCTLNLRPGGAPHPLAAPHRYTVLFFPDEAVACAAGHRPCAECRRPVWLTFRAAWGRAFGNIPAAPEIDRLLHAARVTRDRRQITHQAPAQALPFGAMFRHDGQFWLRCVDGAKPYDHLSANYGRETCLPKAMVEVLTPKPLVSVMAAGWRPALSADEDQPGWPAQNDADLA